jgi:hypothetical protein
MDAAKFVDELIKETPAVRFRGNVIEGLGTQPTALRQRLPVNGTEADKPGSMR